MIKINKEPIEKLGLTISDGGRWFEGEVFIHRKNHGYDSLRITNDKMFIFPEESYVEPTFSYEELKTIIENIEFIDKEN